MDRDHPIRHPGRRRRRATILPVVLVSAVIAVGRGRASRPGSRRASSERSRALRPTTSADRCPPARRTISWPFIASRPTGRRTLLDPMFRLERDWQPADLVPVEEAGISGSGSIRLLVVDDLRSMTRAARADGIRLARPVRLPHLRGSGPDGRQPRAGLRLRVDRTVRGPARSLRAPARDGARPRRRRRLAGGQRLAPWVRDQLPAGAQPRRSPATSPSRGMSGTSAASGRGTCTSPE